MHNPFKFRHLHIYANSQKTVSKAESVVKQRVKSTNEKTSSGELLKVGSFCE